MREWHHNILARNHAEIMLSEIPHNYYESDDSYRVYVVTGYKVKILVKHHPATLIAAYSPLIGGFIGACKGLVYYSSEGDIRNSAPLDNVPLTPEPLDDNTSKLILMADCIKPLVCATLVRGEQLYPWQFRDPVGEDMTLNLVSCIRQQEKEKRDRLMRLFDTYGPPDGPLGDALMHIDKFRSL